MMEAWGITDVGLVRRENQDAFRIRQGLPSGHTVCVVCDGMGGAAGGRLASQIAAETFTSEIERRLIPGMGLDALRDASAQAVAAANQAVRRAAEETEGCYGMGTTLVAAVSYGCGALLANVGDSRAYHLSERGIRRVTKDHSLVERMVDRGDITREEARRHPNRNLITRALGPEDDLACDSFVQPMEPGEYLLLCSDGLVGTVTDQEMLSEVLRAESPEECLKRLIALSKERGASDNVTAVLMRMQ